MSIDETSIIDAIKEAVESGLDEATEAVLAELKRTMSQMLVQERLAQAEFEKRLYERWAKALDLFETARVIALEAGEKFNRIHRPQATKEKNFVFDVLTKLHARACLTASEVLALLKSGHASGALSRQRTLHELAVVAFFIHEQGNEVAERYLLHEAVESMKGVRQYEEYCTRLGYKPLEPDTIVRLQEQYEALCARFGDTFKATYGWAAQALNKKNPTIEDIERAVKLDHMRPYYRMASHGIHPNPKGISFDIGNVKVCSQKVLPAGPSNAGLADPGHLTLISLIQCTSVLLSIEWDIETMITMRVLQHFVDEAGRAFLEIHHQLVREELEIAKWESEQLTSEPSSVDNHEE